MDLACLPHAITISVGATWSANLINLFHAEEKGNVKDEFKNNTPSEDKALRLSSKLFISSNSSFKHSFILLNAYGV
mgnify:CR=1 FL=1